MRAEWKCASGDIGGQYVMTPGILEMQVLPADSLVSPQNVSILNNSHLLGPLLLLSASTSDTNSMSELLSLTKPSYYSRKRLIHENHFMGANNIQSCGAVPQNHGHYHYQGYQIAIFQFFLAI